MSQLLFIYTVLDKIFYVKSDLHAKSEIKIVLSFDTSPSIISETIPSGKMPEANVGLDKSYLIFNEGADYGFTTSTKTKSTELSNHLLESVLIPLLKFGHTFGIIGSFIKV